jgi:hypothetical protein
MEAFPPGQPWNFRAETALWWHCSTLVIVGHFEALAKSPFATLSAHTARVKNQSQDPIRVRFQRRNTPTPFSLCVVLERWKHHTELPASLNISGTELPLGYMLRHGAIQRRDAMAKAAVPYLHPQLQSIQLQHTHHARRIGCPPLRTQSAV